MKIIKSAMAGTMESSDVMILVEPTENGQVEINLKSTVENQYGDHIRAAILETVKRMNVEGIKINANDRGALDCTVKARVMTALHRAAGSEDYEWRQ